MKQNTQTRGGNITVHFYTQKIHKTTTMKLNTQTRGGNITVHIYTQTIHKTTQ